MAAPPLKLDGRLLAVESGQLAEAVRYVLADRRVVAGGYRTAAEHEKHVLSTVGSVDWFSFVEADEFRFHPLDGSLRSVALVVPESALDDWDSEPDWTGAPELIGVPRLVDLAEFRAIACDVRAYSVNGNLWCFRPQSLRAPSSRLRLRITPGLHLLFAEGDFVGWYLERAETSLSGQSEQHGHEPPDPELSTLLGEYLDIVKFPELDDLLEGSPVLKSRLDDIVARARSHGGSPVRRRVLTEQIGALVREWYE